MEFTWSRGLYKGLSDIYLVSSTEQIGFPGGSVVKNLPANVGDTGDAGSIPWSARSPGAGTSKPRQYHSSILAWKIPRTAKPGRLQSMGTQRVRVRHDWVAEHTHGREDCPGLLPPGTILQAALTSWQRTVLPQILDRRESLEDCPLTFKYFLKEVTM